MNAAFLLMTTAWLAGADPAPAAAPAAAPVTATASGSCGGGCDSCCNDCCKPSLCDRIKSLLHHDKCCEPKCCEPCKPVCCKPVCCKPVCECKPVCCKPVCCQPTCCDPCCEKEHFFKKFIDRFHHKDCCCPTDCCGGGPKAEPIPAPKETPKAMPKGTEPPQARMMSPQFEVSPVVAPKVETVEVESKIPF